jgi:uncharacterized RDD family membrane protein YckC
MLLVMNATAQASAASISGPKLDNRRVLAALLDLGIVVAGTLVILFAGDALSGDRSEIQGALGAVILGWALYYYFAMESGDGQTVGKKVMKLRVVLADGRPAGMREIAMRTVLRVVDGVGGYIVGLIVMLATGQRRQRLGDLAAGTIVVDASAAPAYVPPAPVVEPVEDEPVEDEPNEDEPNNYEPTITLPSRPAAPATLADLSAPEAPSVPEMRPFDPPVVEDEVVADAPVEDAPVEDEVVEDAPVEDAPVEDEPVEDEVAEDAPLAAVEVVEVEEPIEDEPVAEDSLAQMSTPSMEELARDVAAAQSDPLPAPTVELVEPVEDEVEEDEPVTLEVVADEPGPALEIVKDEPEDEPSEDEPFTLKSVETVSAIDLVMGGASDEDDSEQDLPPETPAAS